MRWQRLFDDLEAQAREAERVTTREEVADRTRRERATVSLLDRLAAAPDQVVVEVETGLRIEGEVRAVGRDWFVVDQPGRTWLVPVMGVVEIRGLGEGAESAGLARRAGLGLALRALSRDRVHVAVHDRAGRVTQGRIEAVGADWLDLVDRTLDRRTVSGNGAPRRCLPWLQVVAIMSRVAVGGAGHTRR